MSPQGSARQRLCTELARGGEARNRLFHGPGGEARNRLFHGPALEKVGFLAAGRTVEWRRRDLFLAQVLQTAFADDVTKLALEHLAVGSVKAHGAAQVKRGLGVAATFLGDVSVRHGFCKKNTSDGARME